jgi:hypothetical protein
MASDLRSIFGSLLSFLGELQAGKVKDARIALFQEKLEDLRERMVQLEEENSRLLAEQAATAVELTRYRKAAKTTPRKGALWVRRPTGGYDDTPLCPQCSTPMVAPGMGGYFNVVCGDSKGCGYTANFLGRDIPGILRELDAEWQASRQGPGESA